MKRLVYIILFLLISLNSFAQDGKKTATSSTDITKISVYPNPFNDKTTINFYSSDKGTVDFIVQDLLGNVIKSENILLTAGKNSIPFYKNKLAAGIYIYTLKTKDKFISKRFVIK